MRSGLARLKDIGTNSLKKRLFVILLLSSTIPILLIGYASYGSLNALQNNNVRAGIQDNLGKVKLALENSLSNLRHVSQQLALGGKVGHELYEYLTNESLIERKLSANEVEEEMGFIFSTNPSISLMLYYNDETEQYYFQNFPIRDNFSLRRLPVLTRVNDIVFYGPHRTFNGGDDRFVLSLLRKVNVYDISNMYIYIESNNKIAEDMFQSAQYGMNIAYLLVNHEGFVTYSEVRDTFPVGSSYGQYNKKELEKTGFYTFEEKSDEGWTVVGIISKAVFEKEAKTWLLKMILFSVLSLGISLLFVWIIWANVYKPLTSISKAILSFGDGRPAYPKWTRLKEFDLILRQFNFMSGKINELMNDIREQEKRKARLEVDKLLLQINPHFIHNTLDTVRWMARMNGNDEIDELISTLNRLIYYNLSKGETASLRDEVAALKDYVELQRIRYNFQFNVQIDVEDAMLDVHVPRFILQPIVENALYHGVTDDGLIKVEVGRAGDSHMVIKVTDNGAGITDEAIRQLLNRSAGAERKSGLGIGVQYVIGMLQYRYGDAAQFRIESSHGIGTTITLDLPLARKEDEEVERAAR